MFLLENKQTKSSSDYIFYYTFLLLVKKVADSLLVGQHM